MTTLRLFLAPLILPILLAAAMTHAEAEGKRVALLVACADYDDDALDLSSPPHDVDAMRKMLVGQMGFDTVLVAGVEGRGAAVRPAELDFKTFHRTLTRFKTEAAGAELAVFYFSGHGIGGLVGDEHTYLMPTDATLADRASLRSEAISTETLLRDLRETGAKTRVAVLDCCRDNPFLQTKGWVQTKSPLRDLVLSQLGEAAIPPATLIAYATSPGRKAAARLDEASRLSPYTAALVDRLPAPGLSLRDAFERAHDAVADATEHRQVPKLDYDSSARVLRELVLVPGRLGEVRPLTAADRLRAATRESPFVNSLGMEFIPVPGKPGVWMCRTETRVRDFRAYAQATGYEQKGGVYTLRVEEKEGGGRTTKWRLDKDASWEKPGFEQGGDHPVSGVSWEEAGAFCEWLGGGEAELGYRLPSDAEWSAAVGTLGKYPWGNAWPPPDRVGNYWDQQFIATLPGEGWPEIREGFDDGAAYTAPVASYAANRFGFYDLGGNVWEWCHDWYAKTMNSAEVRAEFPVLDNDRGGETYRVLRGGSWYGTSSSYLSSSYRSYGLPPAFRFTSRGFRVVLELGGDG